MTTVLVAEDDVNDRLLIETAFQSVGVKGPVHLVNDGLEAIAYLMGEGQYSDRSRFAYPSFIITDLKMPKLDGLAVLQHLKSNPAWSIIPTIVLSASADEDDIRTAYQLGASSFHSKPAKFAELLALVKMIHDYWMSCEIPEVDVSGKQVKTPKKGKLGERFKQPEQGCQTRVDR